MLGVAHLADGGIAILVDAPDFAGRQANLRVALITRHQGGRAPGRAHHLGAASRNDLNVMDRQADGHSSQRQAVAQFSRGRWAAH